MANTNSVTFNGGNFVYGDSWKPTAFTISGWIKPTAVNVTQDIFAGPNNDIELQINSTGKLRLAVYYDPLYDYYDSTTTLTAGVWQFVAATYNASTRAWALYVGTSATPDNSGTGSNTLVWELPVSTISWGARNGSTFYTGSLDDARQYSAVRSGTDIANDCSKELSGSETNLYGYYKFNNNANDSVVSSPHNLTSVNSPTYSTDIAFVWPKAGFLPLL